MLKISSKLLSKKDNILKSTNYDILFKDIFSSLFKSIAVNVLGTIANITDSLFCIIVFKLFLYLIN